MYFLRYILPARRKMWRDGMKRQRRFRTVPEDNGGGAREYEPWPT